MRVEDKSVDDAVEISIKRDEENIQIIDNFLESSLIQSPLAKFLSAAFAMSLPSKALSDDMSSLHVPESTNYTTNIMAALQTTQVIDAASLEEAIGYGDLFTIFTCSSSLLITLFIGYNIQYKRSMGQMVKK